MPLPRCRWASGRRHYNRVRQFRAHYRLTRVAKLLRKTGFRRGYQTEIAKALGVHRSTICRDVRRLYYRRRYGRAADKILQGMAAVAKHALDDARADREYEQRMLEAPSVLEAEDKQSRPPVDPTALVPQWLPSPHTSRAGGVPRVSPGG
jgi:hypothetical protein